MAGALKGTRECRLASKRRHETLLAIYGSEEGIKEFYRTIGRKGGQNGKGEGYVGGFAGNHERAKIAGRKGGHISSRQITDKPSLKSRRKDYAKKVRKGIIVE